MTPDLEKDVLACTRCPLREGCTAPVPDLLIPDCDYFLIGEAPGREEDKAGVPFVGAAGKRLNKLMELAHLDPNKCSFGNIVKCRPPKNRDPRKAELKACSVWLRRALAIAKPKKIITLGRVPLSLFNSQGIKQLHGCQFEVDLEEEFVCLRSKKKAKKKETVTTTGS